MFKISHWYFSLLSSRREEDSEVHGASKFLTLVRVATIPTTTYLHQDQGDNQLRC